MAAPSEITVRNLSGKWDSNSELSDDATPIMELQGVPWIVRAMLANASISVTLRQSIDESGVTKVDSVQTSMGQVVEEARILDWERRDQPHLIFGNMTVRSRFSAPNDVETVLRNRSGSGECDWEEEVIEIEVETAGWKSITIWGFTTIDGTRRYIRRSIARKGGEEKVVQLVYDWAGPIES
ncbi:uncharacterized protein N7484_002776 [Penicillium longicatenatum]|uniref:uncharacterized protein n=1 Tax=Penicillium longicatenatum TaxID=1561947 RepID=UPI002548606F|nr:uncharacterized protein N7484_002776 [Penicillium longicatenatum]KAJ5649053.1 hypothetical protein N7484_002776 [Penicillium longicatenatum]